jgi:uncharacterized membrane protein
MFSVKEYLIALVLIPLLDAPWLLYQFNSSIEMFTRIQGGRAIESRMWAAVVVYLALAYLLLKQNSAQEAFLSGAAVYAVYDFTNLTLLKDYKVEFAVMDTLWGGVLFTAAFYVFRYLKGAF